MNEALEKIFLEEKIEYAEAIPYDLLNHNPNCRKCPDFAVRSVIMMAVPYFNGITDGNISLYARSKDYHLYFSLLSERIIPKIEKLFSCKAMLFADSSPIYETEAACLCGLGVLGKHGLLITEKYSSFVFLGGIFTDCDVKLLTSKSDYSLETCENCNRCENACPFSLSGECLSEITQCKCELTSQKADLMRKYKSVWGCDICQLVCPHTEKLLRSGIKTEIDFFKNDTIEYLNAELLSEMNNEDFKQRAFSWRGRKILQRNIDICKKD